MLLLSSPVGALFVEYGEGGVRAVRFWRQGEHPPAGTRDEPARGDALGLQVVRELREYFTRARRSFSLPLACEGTPFQRRVWEALQRIPFGETRTYSQIAEEVGSAGGSRAVGQANRRNPIPIIVPCHRVIASGGGLGGYTGAVSGPGTDTKRWLLQHESQQGREGKE
jgi:methylated-DNA-[protein]-cysteine S-methyltransferase